MSNPVEELDKIINAGVKSVVHKGTRIEYQSVPDLITAKENAKRATQPFRITMTATHDKGL